MKSAIVAALAVLFLAACGEGPGPNNDPYEGEWHGTAVIGEQIAFGAIVPRTGLLDVTVSLTPVGYEVAGLQDAAFIGTCGPLTLTPHAGQPGILDVTGGGNPCVASGYVRQEGANLRAVVTLLRPNPPSGTQLRGPSRAVYLNVELVR